MRGQELERSAADTPDRDFAGADVHALYLAGERAAIAAGDHRIIAEEPAVRADHRDGDPVFASREQVGGQATFEVVRLWLVSLLRGLLSKCSRLIALGNFLWRHLRLSQPYGAEKPPSEAAGKRPVSSRRKPLTCGSAGPWTLGRD
jgi:hypothetical protein